MAVALPLFALVDMNGGLITGGFTKTTLKEDVKAKPDYITGRVFVAHRKEMPDLM